MAGLFLIRVASVLFSSTENFRLVAFDLLPDFDSTENLPVSFSMLCNTSANAGPKSFFGVPVIRIQQRLHLIKNKISGWCGISYKSLINY